jgi:hypothetical protein
MPIKTDEFLPLVRSDLPPIIESLRRLQKLIQSSPNDVPALHAARDNVQRLLCRVKGMDADGEPFRCEPNPCIEQTTLPLAARNLLRDVWRGVTAWDWPHGLSDPAYRDEWLLTIDAVVNLTNSEAPANPMPEPSLDDEDADILRVLARYQGLRLSLDQITGHSVMRLCRTTVSARIKHLEAQGLIDRPRGRKQGFQITRSGLELLQAVVQRPGK